MSPVSILNHPMLRPVIDLITDAPRILQAWLDDPTPMPAAVRQQWLQALRSGTYTQAYGALRTGEGHCCLGVLCDRLNTEGWSVKEVNKFGCPIDEYTYTTALGESACTLLPDAIRIMVGLPLHVEGVLASCNDQGVPFHVLADLIEQGTTDA